VLASMGVAPGLALGSLRVSLSRETTREEADRAAGLIVGSVLDARASGAGA
jgi:cysteine sulfinate desulfinase/cysteine desulfurase-like protein